MASPNWRRLADQLARQLARELSRAARQGVSRKGGTADAPTSGRMTPVAPAPTAAAGYPGDFAGMPEMVYAADADGQPDPGEVVWCWVPYEEDHAQGKDRPVLLVGRDQQWLLALPLTSKDHDRDEAQERAAGREWMDIGAGAWDSKRRPSEARLDRVIRVDPAGVRREGAILDRAIFERVTAEVRALRRSELT